MVTHRAAEPVERLTWDEICARYPDRWVALADIAWVNDTDFEFTRAEVIATFAARKEASPTMGTPRGEPPIRGLLLDRRARAKERAPLRVLASMKVTRFSPTAT